MIWKETHLSIQGPTVESAYQSKNQAMRLKKLSVELRDRIVSRHRSGEGYKNISAALKVPKNNRGLGQGDDQEPDGHTDRAPEFICGDG
jgi:hypothetical protein